MGLVTLLMVIAGLADDWTGSEDSREPVLALMGSVGVALTFWRGPAAILGVFLGAGFGHLISIAVHGGVAPAPVQWAAALGFGIADAAEAGLALFLAIRLIRWPSPLFEWKSIAIFVWVVAPASALAAAGLDVALELGLNLKPIASPVHRFFEIFAAHATGTGAFVIGLLGLVGQPRADWAPRALAAALLPLLTVFLEGGTWLLRSELVASDRHHYRAVGTPVIDGLQARLDLYTLTSEAVAGFIRSVETPTRTGFREFAEPDLSRHPGIRSLEWIPLIPDARRAEVEAQAQAEGVKGFTIGERSDEGAIVPRAKADFYLPILFAAPSEHAPGILGFDIRSEGGRRMTVELAQSTKATTVSRAIDLLNERGATGVFILTPVFSSRDASLLGFVRVLLDIDRIFEDAGHECAAIGISLVAAELGDSGDSSGIYSNDSDAGEPPLSNSPLTFVKDLSFNNARWQVTMAPTARFQLPGDRSIVLWTSLGAFVVIALSSMVVLGSASSGVLIAREVRGRTQELVASRNRFQAFVENAPAAILAVGPTGAVAMANRMAGNLFRCDPIDLLGVPLANVLGEERAPGAPDGERSGHWMRDGLIGTKRTRCRTRDGQWLDLIVHQSLVSTDEGPITLCVLLQQSGAMT